MKRAVKPNTPPTKFGGLGGVLHTPAPGPGAGWTVIDRTLTHQRHALSALQSYS
jgi:hypothetical protein